MAKLDRLLSVALTLCAIVFASVLVKREFFDKKVDVLGHEDGPPQFIKNWKSLTADAVPLRGSNASVVIIEFADLECPACRQFHAKVRELLEDSHINAGLVMIHYPLPMHRFANAAARAMECAAGAGRAKEFVDLAYAKQDSFGLKPWKEYAAESGVSDTVAFNSCVTSSGRIPRIERGRFLGDSLGVHATPTVIVNGWRFLSVPDTAQLRRVISDIDAGRPPV